MPFRAKDWEIEDLHSYQRAVKSQDPFELDKLSMSADRFVRTRVAGNQHTSPYTLERLIADPFPAVVAAIPTNPNTTPEIVTLIEMTILWRSEGHHLLRSSLMSARYTSTETIQELCSGNSIEMELGRVNRPDCPISILEGYAGTPYERSPRSIADCILQIIRSKARAKLGLPILDRSEEY